MVAAIVAASVALVAGLTEWLHARRVRRLAPLAFGPAGRPARWVAAAAPLRALALASLAWALVTLIFVEPTVYRARSAGPEDFRHVVLVMDVSPSMKLADAGPEGDLARSVRAFDLMESFFKRVSVEQFRLSLIAVYNGAKPVVVDTKDAEVVRNFLDGMDMFQAFDTGQTKLFDGLEEAFRIAAPWDPGSTTLILISDGDTVPATGMPAKPRSVGGVLVVGVGDPQVGKFIDGRQSRQDSATLRQIALRLGGTYHDGNNKHLPSNTIAALTDVTQRDPFERLTRREYALATCAASAALLALLPIALQLAGSRWRPGTVSASHEPLGIPAKELGL